MTRVSRRLSLASGAAALAAILLTMACKTVPPPAKTPPISYEQKMAWVLQLEDQRLLKLPEPAPPAPAPEEKKRGRPPAIIPPPASTPDLTVLVKDQDPRVRRRAALALGRVRLTD